MKICNCARQNLLSFRWARESGHSYRNTSWFASTRQTFCQYPIRSILWKFLKSRENLNLYRLLDDFQRINRDYKPNQIFQSFRCRDWKTHPTSNDLKRSLSPISIWKSKAWNCTCKSCFHGSKLSSPSGTSPRAGTYVVLMGCPDSSHSTQITL